MRSNIVAIANRLIPKPANIEKIRSEFATDDIIKQVLSQFEKHKAQLELFAPYLQAATVKDTCYNIWIFWRDNIRYQADNAGAKQQLVKSPAAVWEDKFCDCKSFAVATMVCLYQLGIKGVFRFVSFNAGTKTIPTHVYVVAHDGTDQIFIDCCLPDFNMQKPYSAKYDYLSQGLYAVNGVPSLRKIVDRNKEQKKCRCRFNLSGLQTEAELDLLIREHQLELEQEKAVKVFGIGSNYDNSYEIELAAINNAICEVGNTRLLTLQGRRYRTLHPAPPGIFIGKPKDRKATTTSKKVKKEAKKTAVAVKKNAAGKGIKKKDQKRLEKINVTVKKKKESILKKVGKGIVKAVTAPVRLLAKGALELTLPKSAPVFLYLFLTDEKVLAKAPAIVKAKRDRAAKIADNIVNKLSMKLDHFMGILRNGIMSNLGDTPENVLAKWMRDANFSIGFLPALATAGKFLLDIVKKVGGAKIEDLQNNAPDPSDWITESSTAREDMANEVQQQPTNNDVQTKPSIPIQTEQQASAPTTNYDSGSSTSLNKSYNTDYTEDKEANKEDDPTGDMLKEKELENVTVKSVKPKESGIGGNTGLLIALAVGAFALSSTTGGGRKKK